MARDGRGKPPPGESSSFDLSKMSEAEVAAEMAERMARFRDTKNRPDASAPAHDPNAETPAAQAEAPQPTSPRGLDATAVARMQRALKLNAQARAAKPERKPERTGARSKRRASAYGMDFKSLLAEGPNMNAIGMRPENPVQRAMLRARGAEASAPDAKSETSAEPAPTQARAPRTIARSKSVPARPAVRPAHRGGLHTARRNARAIGGVVRQAASDRFVVAGVVAIAAAILVWLLIPVDHHPMPEIAHTPEATPAPAITTAHAPEATSPPPVPAVRAREAAPPPAITTARATTAPSEVAPPHTPPIVEARTPTTASPPVSPDLKPPSRVPHLVARLKPTISKPAKLSAKPKPTAQSSISAQQATENSRNPADSRTIERLLQ